MWFQTALLTYIDNKAVKLFLNEIGRTGPKLHRKRAMVDLDMASSIRLVPAADMHVGTNIGFADETGSSAAGKNDGIGGANDTAGRGVRCDGHGRSRCHFSSNGSQI